MAPIYIVSVNNTPAVAKELVAALVQVSVNGMLKTEAVSLTSSLEIQRPT